MRMMASTPRFLQVGLITVTVMLLGASAASASHLKGGTMTATISPTGKLEGSITAFQREEPCEVASGETESYELAIVAPDGTTKTEFEVETKLVRCIGTTGVFRANFSYELNDASGAFGATAPGGLYTVSASNCCRVNGIINSNESGFSLNDTVRNVPGTETSTPQFLGLTATGAAKGYVYSGDVSASDPLGGGLTYALLQSEDPMAANYDPKAPESNVVTLNGTRVDVPAATTETWSDGAYFVYKVKTTDAATDSAELDILVKVTTNRPPTLTVPSEVTVVAGETMTVPLSATDPDPETVTINTDSVPSWAEVTSSSGNAATGTATLAPPPGTSGTYYAALDAEDSNAEAVLLDSKVITIHVVPPQPDFLTHPEAQSSDPTPIFTFQAPAGTESQCSLDGAPWVPCASPVQTPALAAGSHTFSIRAVGSGGAISAVRTYAWTVLAAAVAPSSTPATATPSAASPPRPAPCVSRRTVVVHWRIAARQKVGAMVVSVSGMPTRRLSANSRKTTIDLRGMHAATVTVTISTSTRSGKRLKTQRVLHTCQAQKSVPQLGSLALH